MFKKSSIWSYEREFPAVRLASDEADSDYLDVPLTSNQLPRIIFGCRTPESAIEELSSLASEFLPEIELWCSRKHRTRFAPTFERI